MVALEIKRQVPNVHKGPAMSEGSELIKRVWREDRDVRALFHHMSNEIGFDEACARFGPEILGKDWYEGKLAAACRIMREWNTERGQHLIDHLIKGTKK